MKLKEMIKKILIEEKQEEVIFNHFDVKKILLAQKTGSLYSRMDIIVRLLAIENEYGLNDYGWHLYNKMQTSRCKNKKSSLSIDDRVNKFKVLIKSWEKNGYDNNSYITIDENYHLIDGSHRLALCIYHEINSINCKIYRKKIEYVDYGIAWFENNGFCSEEIAIILDKYNKILK